MSYVNLHHIIHENKIIQISLQRILERPHLINSTLLQNSK